MGSKISRCKFYLLLITTGLLWFLLVNYLLQLSLQRGVYFDSENYKDAADLLYHHLSFHFYRPIAIAAFCGIPYLFGYGDAQVYAFAVYLNFACWIGTSLLLFGMLKQFVNQRKAFCYTLCFFVTIGAVLSTFHLLTESFYTFTIAAGFYFLSEYYRTRQFNYLSGALAIFLLSMLIKPGSQYFAILLVLYYLRVLLRNWRRPGSLFLYGSLLLIGLQLCGMKKQYGNYTISYISGPTFYNYLGARSIGLKEHKTLRQVQRYRMHYIFDLDYPQQQIVGFSDLGNQLRNNIQNLAQAYAINLSENTKTPSDCLAVVYNVKGEKHFEFYKRAAEIITKWQNRIFTVSGFLLALWYLATCYRKNIFYTLVGFYIVYTVILSGLSCYQGDRFHIVFFPMVIVLWAKLLDDLWHKRKKAARLEQL